MNKEELFEVIKQAKGGSEKAFSLIYKTFRNQIYNHVYYLVKNREDAEDITSEALTKAFMKIHGYQEDFSFLMWLRTIAVNTVIDYTRKKGKNVLNKSIEKDGDCSELSSLYDLSPEDSYIELEHRNIVEQNIDNLKGQARLVATHRYIDGLSYKEIAEKMGLNIGTIKAHISKTTKKIKPKN